MAKQGKEPAVRSRRFVSFEIDEQLGAMLDSYLSADPELSRSEVLREALWDYLIARLQALNAYFGDLAARQREKGIEVGPGWGYTTLAGDVATEQNEAQYEWVLTMLRLLEALEWTKRSDDEQQELVHELRRLATTEAGDPTEFAGA